MKPVLALTYAIISIVFMLGISFAISLRMPFLTLALAVVTVLFIGSGFVLKARMRKRSLSPTEES
ncbi:MAG: YlaF family protein [Gorillibacterium sp.]|nr:YlaF family protein [Gorillibacterium sp.]